MGKADEIPEREFDIGKGTMGAPVELLPWCDVSLGPDPDWEAGLVTLSELAVEPPVGIVLPADENDTDCWPEVAGGIAVSVLEGPDADPLLLDPDCAVSDAWFDEDSPVAVLPGAGCDTED